MSADSGELLVKPPVKRWVFLLVVTIMVLMYWTYAHFIENIDMTTSLNAVWYGRFPGGSNLPPVIITFVELFHWRVLRHFIPVITGWIIAYWAAVSLVRILYDLPDYSYARRFLSRLITAQTTGEKAVAVSSQTLEALRSESIMLRVGGPGQLVIPPGEVGVSEINGRYYRILPSGKNNLKPFEYVHSVLSLRTQERQVTDVALVTNDAMTLTADYTISFHIDRDGEMPTRNQPYPFRLDAVEKAAYTQTNSGEKVFDWMAQAANSAKGILVSIASKYTFDELMHPAGGSVEPYYQLTQELERKVRNKLEDFGAELASIRIDRLDLSEEAEQQYIDYWLANMETQITLEKAEGAASSLEITEIARAEAEIIMIRAIAEGLESARQAGNMNTMRDIIALRMVEALEKMALQSQADTQVPPDVLTELEALRGQIDPQNQLPAASQASPEETS
jgi:regulator of protease activity HflC (stomatin/prohibitin superfamily)